MPYTKARSARRVLPGIYQEGPHRFRVQARWTNKKGQEKKRKGLATSLEEAVSLKAKLLQDLQDETGEPKLSRQRFKDYATHWLRNQSSLVRPSTASRYMTDIAHAIGAFGSFYVDAITVSDIRKWVQSMAEDSAPSTVNTRLRALRQALEPLVEDGILNVNPARKVKGLQEKGTQGRRGTALPAEQFKKFITTTRAMMADESISEDIGRMLLVLAFTGMRKGECMALKWSDLLDGELLLQHGVWRRTEGPTKAYDQRHIPLVGMLASVFKEQRAWLVATKHPGLESDLIFPASPPHAKGSATRRKVDTISWYRSGSTLDDPLRRVIKSAGINDVCPHSFRRTFENLLRQAGVDDLVRRSLAGWSTDDAQAIYAGIAKTEREDASKRMFDFVMSSSNGIEQRQTAPQNGLPRI